LLKPRERRQRCKALQEIQTDLAAELTASWRMRSQDEFVDILDLLRVNNLENQMCKGRV